MRHADFVHLVRLSEHASAEDSAAYRRGLALFAGLGYAWVLGCFLLAAGLLAWVVETALAGQLRAVHGFVLVAAGGLLWNSARALWVRLEPPRGIALRPHDAPPLFEIEKPVTRMPVWASLKATFAINHMLPTEINPAEVKATLENGVLHLTLPIAEVARVQTVPVTVVPA